MKNLYLLKIILINFLVFLFVYTILEIFTGQIIFKKKLKCSYILCNANYTYKTSLYTKEKITIKYKKDKYGFRGRYKLINQIDILTMGGSTTDERYLNLNDTWSEQLELNFKKNNKSIDVVNAGIDGQSSFGHIWNFKNWINKIEGFSAKYILFYIGVNEKNYSGRHDFNPNEVSYPKKILYLLKYNDGITNKIYEFVVHRYNPVDELNVAHSKYRSPNYLSIKKNDPDEFERLEENIEELIKLSKVLNAKPIFFTQKTLRWKKIENNLFSISSDTDFYSREKKISDLIINTCRRHDAICVNGFEIINFNELDTYDLVHTTPVGSKKIADVLFNKLNAIKF